MQIDLTAELGRSGVDPVPEAEQGLWPLVSTVLIPCGLHRGDPTSMLRACGEAATRRAVVGASVGYADRTGGGERFVDDDPDDLAAAIVYQLGALDGLAGTEQQRVTCVRPAGALFEATRTNRNHAWAVVSAILDFDPSLAVISLPGSRLSQTAERQGLRVLREFQPHRLLNPNGSHGAVVTDPGIVASRALEAATSGEYDSIRLPLDSSAERACAQAVSAALLGAGITVTSPLNRSSRSS